MLSIRKAVPEDFPVIMDIYGIAQEYMIRSGNATQWGRSFPPEELIREDIRKGICHVICDDEGIHGVFAVCTGEEPTYQVIENGSWLNDEPYITGHRLAGDGKVHGLFSAAADYMKSLIDNVRVDTHENNKTMQHLIEKEGFVRCGIVYMADGSPRIAYQWEKRRCAE
ncbi:MAG: N-acetyltransferase [Lachnospiraceae bacterium]|nr:N-acetyltransferase [Lachnospiraceae bacterium]